MRFLLLNQTFHPDVVSTAQHLTDLALALVERGHQVTVVASRRAYDDPQTKFPARELWRGIEIRRVSCTGFGKGAKWRRAADFGSFLAGSLLKLLFIPKPDVVVALTSPPLISFFGAWMARLRRVRFMYWVMDFNPDEAIAAGWLRAGSLAARLLERISRFSLRHADRIIALDRFMADRIAAKGITAGKIIVIPPWSHDTAVRFDAVERETFRRKHGFSEQFVVMYSGNHSPCHPLDTLLSAARKLAADPRIVFCFIGGGSEFKRVQQIAAAERLSNIKCLPYQPLDQLSGSLSAADLHAVVMGNDFVGLVHPCKIYNILNIGAPVLYIGPQPAHIPDILQQLNGSLTTVRAAHGETDKVVSEILRLREQTASGHSRSIPSAARDYSHDALVPRMLATFESPK